MSQRLEKSTDLPREEYIKINHELSVLYDKYDCYKKYMVLAVSVFDGVARYKGNSRGKGDDSGGE